MPRLLSRWSAASRLSAWATRTVRRSTAGLDDRVKRGFDLVGTGLLFLPLLPLFGLIALLIKLDGDGPVLFWQTRVGRWGQHFDFPKFRTMRPDAESVRRTLEAQNFHGDGITFKIKDDPRVTRVGRVLRRFSLDELPQFWCVLRGDMSLVGPRPPIPSEVARYTIPHRRRLDAIPGLTCLWQVSGRSDLHFDKQVELDIEYIENRSVAYDLVLLLRTVPAVLSGRGAY